ncbi:MAG: DNA/RNA nuclease SfsA [Sulfuricellaceae bacterium]
MLFPSPLLEGRLLKRYQRFLADVALADGSTVTAHCPNTGSMLGCKEPGSRVWLSRSANSQRKLPFTWEIVEALPEVLVGVNTGLANRLVEEAIANGAIAELQGYSRIRREVRFGAENSRVDLLLEGDGPSCYVEVKNVTAAVENGVAIFPDAVSGRGAKHLRELAAMAEAGHRAVLCFCVQRRDVAEVRPADAIDPVYGRTLREAMNRGMEAIAYRAEISPAGIELRHPLPVACPLLPMVS